MTDPASRVRTPLGELAAHVTREYSLGTLQEWSVLTTGYEDCNLTLRGSDDPFGVVVKVFAVARPRWTAHRTASLISAARAACVRHPRVRPDASGRLVHPYDGHQLMVMDLVPGQTFYELGRPPAGPELAEVVRQAVLIHSIDAHPEPVPDPWAIANLVPLSARVSDLLTAEQRRLVDEAIAGIVPVDPATLPETLIHADLTAGNVLLEPDGAVAVLDFALANRWPRLQEIAVIGASLLHGSPEPVPARVRAVASLYSSLSPLTGPEWEALDAFGRAAAAMELLGGLDQWGQGNQGDETSNLIEIGTSGLRDYA